MPGFHIIDIHQEYSRIYLRIISQGFHHPESIVIQRTKILCPENDQGHICLLTGSMVPFDRKQPLTEFIKRESVVGSQDG